MSGSQWLTHALFEPHVGDSFDVALADPDGGPLRLVLSETSESTEAGGRGPDGQSRQQFSLVFSGPVERVLPQRTYAVRHPDLGDLGLFLVPLGPQGGAMRYEAASA